MERSDNRDVVLVQKWKKMKKKKKSWFINGGLTQNGFLPADGRSFLYCCFMCLCQQDKRKKERQAATHSPALTGWLAGNVWHGVLWGSAAAAGVPCCCSTASRKGQRGKHIQTHMPVWHPESICVTADWKKNMLISLYIRWGPTSLEANHFILWEPTPAPLFKRVKGGLVSLCVCTKQLRY